MRIDGHVAAPALPGLSVVIPALNASGTLPETLAALGEAPGEILLVDGGSADATVALAVETGVRAILAPRGRGGQLAAGIAAAHGPWLLLLHADTRLGAGWAEAVAEVMQASDGDHRAWHFRLALDDGSAAARWLERVVALRCRLLRLPYGDQALLIHSSLLAAVGGMRALPLMEDVDLVWRLGRSRIGALPVAALTSAERWRRDGWVARSARNLFCLSLWLCGVPPARIARLYAGGARR